MDGVRPFARGGHLTSTGTGGYRARLYDRYSTFQGGEPSTDLGMAREWGRSYDWYLRGWLPAYRDAAVFDAACGDGKFLLFLKDRGYSHLRAVDLSPEQVVLSRRILPEVEEREATEALRDLEGKLDLVVALDLIEHLTRNEVLSFLDACRSALRPGGRLILQTPNADSPWGVGVFAGDMTHETFFSPEGLRRMLLLCGFGDIELRETGPTGGGRSFIRAGLWRLIRLAIAGVAIVETGDSGSGVFTRVFLASGVRT